MTLTIAGEKVTFVKNTGNFVGSLQSLQRRILCLRWKNFSRSTPSSKLAQNLIDMYDQTVMVLVFYCGKDAPVREVDAEKWDLYWESLTDTERFSVNKNVTRAQAIEHVSREFA